MNEGEPASPTAAPAYQYNSQIQPDIEPASSASHASDPAPIPAKVTVVAQAPLKLTPPAPISFETTPVPWKGMPLEPALCKLSFSQLDVSSIIELFFQGLLLL
jgi:hypothetical protein